MVSFAHSKAPRIKLRCDVLNNLNRGIARMQCFILSVAILYLLMYASFCVRTVQKLCKLLLERLIFRQKILFIVKCCA